MILNLVNKEKSQINYDIISFSDSQKLLHIDIKHSDNVTILSRFSWEDLQLIISANRIFKNRKCKVKLIIPYLLGARSDRKFDKFGLNYLKDVVCHLLNNEEFDKITVYDPHSYCSEMGLNNFDSVYPVAFLQDTLTKLQVSSNNLQWLIPDLGASKKAYELANIVQFNKPLIQCSKKRNEKGEIVSTSIESSIIFEGEDCIILDDICDGARTFIELAKEAKKLGAGKLYLFVTHGIFSKGLVELSQYFEHIYCTNSVTDIIHPKVTQFDLYV